MVIFHSYVKLPEGIIFKKFPGNLRSSQVPWSRPIYLWSSHWLPKDPSFIVEAWWPQPGPRWFGMVKLPTVFQLFSLVKSWSFINFYTSVGRIPYRTTLTGVCCKPYFTSISGGVKETLKVPQKYRKLVVVNNAIPQRLSQDQCTTMVALCSPNSLSGFILINYTLVVASKRNEWILRMDLSRHLFWWTQNM